VTFLHVYHHASMCVLWWMVCKWIPGKAAEKGKGKIRDKGKGRVGEAQIGKSWGGMGHITDSQVHIHFRCRFRYALLKNMG